MALTIGKLSNVAQAVRCQTRDTGDGITSDTTGVYCDSAGTYGDTCYNVGGSSTTKYFNKGDEDQLTCTPCPAGKIRIESKLTSFY
jgi:hypothetical protein